jgi:sterol 24-C-methyltransferase
VYQPRTRTPRFRFQTENAERHVAVEYALTIRFKRDRISTILRSFWALYTLPKEQVESFLGAYNIFDHDWSREDELRHAMGDDYYQEIKNKIVHYYNVLNQLCSLGQIEKMYIPPAIDLSKSIMENQILFEQRMCRDLGLDNDTVALDIGCGRGRVASGMAVYSGTKVFGINIDPTQIAIGNQFALAHGLADLCQFAVGDMNDLPLPFSHRSLDAIYHIQALTYSRDLGGLFRDIYRLLKPGGKFASLDWVTLPDYDPSDVLHADLMRRIKPLIGAIGTPTSAQYVSLLERAGFNVLVSENPSVDGLQAPLIENAERFYRHLASGLNWGIRCKILPRHFQLLFDRLRKDGEALVEADRLRLVTTSHYIVAQKPADG